MQENLGKDNPLCRERFCKKINDSSEKRYILDGILYPPCYSSGFEVLAKESPVLLSSCDDAKLIRNWFRELENHCDLNFLDLMWLHISSNFGVQESSIRDVKNEHWKTLPAKQRLARANSIQGCIDKLIKELAHKNTPYIPPAYELLQSTTFFWIPEIAQKMHTYSKRESRKPIYQESISDLLGELSKYLDSKKTVSRNDERPKTGNSEKRGFARIMQRSLLNTMTSYKVKSRKRPLAVIAALVRLRFGDEDGEPSSDHINNWLRKKT